jgi:hypothetical protein
VILQALLPLCFAALVLVACSEDGGEPERSQTGTASAGDGGEAVKVRTVPEQGPLSAGRYSTGERFEPSFSFELGEGWIVLRSSEPQSLKLGYVAPGQEVAQGKRLRFLSVREVLEPRERCGDVLFESNPAPDDLVAWLQRRPYVSTEKPEPVDVGGIPGKQLEADVEVPEGYRDAEGGGCAVPCIPLLRLGSGSVSHITEKGKDRFIILEDVQGETVIIVVSAPADKFEEFLPKAQKALDTVEWGARRSTQALFT